MRTNSQDIDAGTADNDGKRVARLRASLAREDLFVPKTKVEIAGVDSLVGQVVATAGIPGRSGKLSDGKTFIPEPS